VRVNRECLAMQCMQLLENRVWEFITSLKLDAIGDRVDRIHILCVLRQNFLIQLPSFIVLSLIKQQVVCLVEEFFDLFR
jgi:hypothetical protein